MAIPFSQALESRHYDISRLFMTGMLIAVPFAVLWGYWFCTASVPVYETSHQFRLADKELTRTVFPGTGGGAMRTQSIKNRKIIAVFPAKAIKNIVRHQQGYFFPETDSNKQAGAVSVTVSEVYHLSSEKSGRVTLVAKYPTDRADPFADQTKGKICIAVGQTTPMSILARASGLVKEQSLPVAFQSHRTTQ